MNLTPKQIGEALVELNKRTTALETVRTAVDEVIFSHKDAIDELQAEIIRLTSEVERLNQIIDPKSHTMREYDLHKAIDEMGADDPVEKFRSNL